MLYDAMGKFILHDVFFLWIRNSVAETFMVCEFKFKKIAYIFSQSLLTMQIWGFQSNQTWHSPVTYFI